MTSPRPSPRGGMMTVPRFRGEGRIEFIEKAVPEPGPGELLIRVRANALCGSERGQYLRGSEVTPGHETAGVVAAAGPGTRTPVGTPGVVFLMDFCGACRSCELGFTNQCLDKRADMGFNRDGGYGPYSLIRENIFFPVDEDLDFAEATLLLDIMGTGGHALDRARLVRPDIQSVLVAGAGPIGLGVAAMARVMFGEEVNVYISDVVENRLERAELWDAAPVNLLEETPEEALKRYGAGKVDVAIDTSGKGTARQACMGVLAQRGVLVCVGHGEGLNLEVSRDLIAPERAVFGSEYFPYSDLPKNLERLRRHRESLGWVISHRFPVSEIETAFETFFGGASGKVIVEQ